MSMPFDLRPERVATLQAAAGGRVAPAGELSLAEETEEGRLSLRGEQE